MPSRTMHGSSLSVIVHGNVSQTILGWLCALSDCRQMSFPLRLVTQCRGPLASRLGFRAIVYSSIPPISVCLQFSQWHVDRCVYHHVILLWIWHAEMRSKSDFDIESCKFLCMMQASFNVFRLSASQRYRGKLPQSCLNTLPRRFLHQFLRLMFDFSACFQTLLRNL